MSDSLRPHGLFSSPGQNTGMGNISLFQGIFPIQGSNPDLPTLQANPPANAGEAGWIPGLRRSSGRGQGKLLQYSCLENPVGGGGWWTMVYRVTQSWTQLKWLSTVRICLILLKMLCSITYLPKLLTIYHEGTWHTIYFLMLIHKIIQ